MADSSDDLYVSENLYNYGVCVVVFCVWFFFFFFFLGGGGGLQDFLILNLKQAARGGSLRSCFQTNNGIDGCSTNQSRGQTGC